MMTGASRTDTGVHAQQNYFHFDFDEPVTDEMVYRLNAILPGIYVYGEFIPVLRMPIAVLMRKAGNTGIIYMVRRILFMADRAYFYPYPLDWGVLEEVAARLKEFNDFTSFSKRRTQVKHFRCSIFESQWVREDGDTLLPDPGKPVFEGNGTGV